MRSSQEMYKEVAERCSSYTKKSGKSCCCNSGEAKSCLNCDHFANSHCKLDLYDPIAKNIEK